MREERLGRFVAECFWAGGVVVASGKHYYCLLQSRHRSVEWHCGAASAADTTTPHPTIMFVDHFKAEFTLLLEVVAAGFVVEDAGPRNLGVTCGGCVRLIAWEAEGNWYRPDLLERVRDQQQWRQECQQPFQNGLEAVVGVRRCGEMAGDGRAPPARRRRRS